MKLFLYIFTIGFTIATYRAGFKLITINGLLGVSLVGLCVALLGSVGYLTLHGLSFPKMDFHNILGISIASVSLVISSYLIILGLQSGFKVATFTPSYAIASTLFIYLIGIVVFKDTVTLKNTFGLFLGLIAVYFLSLK